jgi:hypothetical protein
MSEWQPAETAPKDGTRVILFFPSLKNKIQVGHYMQTETRDNGEITYQNEGWFFGGFGLHNSFVPSHWMPLPEPPK